MSQLKIFAFIVFGLISGLSLSAQVLYRAQGFSASSTLHFNFLTNGLAVHDNRTNSLYYLELIYRADNSSERRIVEFSLIGSGGDGWVFFGVEQLGNNSYSQAIWWNPSTSEVGFWALSALGERLGWYIIGRGGPGYRLVGFHDMTGDGLKEVLWHNPNTGLVGYWRLDPDRFTGGNWTIVGTQSTQFRPVMVTELNGDGFASLVWEAITPDLAGWRTNTAWLFTGPTSYDDRTLRGSGADWRHLGAIDVTGDGRREILWYNPSINGFGAWQLNFSTNAPPWRNMGASANSSWRPLGAVTLNEGDTNQSFPAIIWLNVGSGDLGIWRLNSSFQQTWIPGVGNLYQEINSVSGPSPEFFRDIPGTVLRRIYF